jgi:hypothetical protein
MCTGAPQRSWLGKAPLSYSQARKHDLPDKAFASLSGLPDVRTLRVCSSWQHNLWREGRRGAPSGSYAMFGCGRPARVRRQNAGQNAYATFGRSRVWLYSGCGTSVSPVKRMGQKRQARRPSHFFQPRPLEHVHAQWSTSTNASPDPCIFRDPVCRKRELGSCPPV